LTAYLARPYNGNVSQFEKNEQAMYYNVSQQLKEGVGSHRTYIIDETVRYDDPAGESTVAGTLDFLYTGRSILVTGRLKAEVVDLCGRCLEKFTEHLTVNVEEEFFPMRDINTGVSLGLPEDTEDAFRIDERFTLDLYEAVRQAIITTIPMNPLCKPNCQGLCPECGSNLNHRNCNCARSPADVRWNALRSLLDTSDEDDRNGTTG